MENTVKVNEIPHQAVRLYIKLYCERKGKKNKKILKEAKKSWLSLSLSKRKLFYETTHNRNLLNDTHILCKSKTYLKEKYPNQAKTPQPTIHVDDDHDSETVPNLTVLSSINASNLSENDCLMEYNTKECEINIEKLYVSKENNLSEFESHIEVPDDTIPNTRLDDIVDSESHTYSSPDHNNINKTLCEPIPPTVVNSTSLEDATGSNSDSNQDCNSTTGTKSATIQPPPSNTYKTKLDDIVDSESDAESNPDHNVTKTLSEPIPPTVTNGKDLYNMIKKSDGPDFKALSSTDKAHYNIAVRNLKKEYIKSYTLYLKSLSKKELFDHYVKTMYS